MKRHEKVNFVRRAAADGMVLLKNDNNALPLNKDSKIALFGITSYKCFRLGWGSGDMLAQKIEQINEGLEAAGFSLDSEVDSIYKSWIDAHSDEYKAVNRDWAKWVFRFNEADISLQDIENASKRSNVAIVTIGRCSGEADDLKNEEGFHKLHKEEYELIKNVSEKFEKTILVMNVCGVLDITSIEDCKVDAILNASLGGEQFGNSVADIISGAVNPSGKLTTTWAKKYEDYPTCAGVDTKEVPYNEGIYVGYRYFDTFGVEPRFPFGYGLSYTDFEMSISDIHIDSTTVILNVNVKNIGDKAGKEVVQCYISAPDGKLEKPYQELCAYAKTNEIAPNETEDAIIAFDLTDMAHYDEENAEFILEKGKYIIRYGNSSRNTHVACALELDKTVVCEKVRNRFPENSGKLELISKKGAKSISYSNEVDEINNTQVFKIDSESIETEFCDKEYEKAQILPVNANDKIITLDDVYEEKATLDDLVSQFSDEELACMLNGVIYSGSDANATVGSMSSKVKGAAGEMWTSEKYKIPTNACADGPAGVRLSIFGTPESDDGEIAHMMVAYPSGTCLANSWDLDAAYQMGVCVADDLKIADIEGWLAPGINIHRNPLNGRNFEYYSEDPLIAGNIGAYVTYGVQYDEDGNPTGRYTTIKHFACNDIEYERGVSDSIVSERALREIYLKGFKIAVQLSAPLAIMTAYNKINGEFASTNFDLLNGALRSEWGYDGIVMTDWNPCADSKKHSAAGNDLIMPGCHRKDIIQGLSDETVDRAEAQACAVRILNLILNSNYIIKNS